MMRKLIEQVLKTIRNYDMLKPGDRVLAAVSGGPDSVFLLYALHSLKKKLGMDKLCVCNLDHGLRGKESREDSLFVKGLAARLELELIQKKINLKRTKPKGLSTEELAREERYHFFGEAAKRTKAGVIATGHTLDDQAETVLMRIVRGSSSKGVVGILPVRKLGHLRIVRPLLELEKSQIRKALDVEGMPYRIDSTNLEPIYFRNVVRKDIIPFLERYNPRLKRAMFSLAEHLREDLEFINEAKSEFGKNIRETGRGRLEIKLKDMVIQPKALQKEILRDALDKIGGEVKKLSFRHWKELEYFIKYKRAGSSIDLPGGVRVTRKTSALVFHLL